MANTIISFTRNIIAFIGLLAVFFISGCATGPKFTAVNKVPNKALIYVYRRFNVGGMASWHRLYANGELVADFANDSYCPYLVSPGQITFSSKSESASPIIDLVNSRDNLLTIEAAAGQTYYAEFHIGDTWGPKLILMSEDVGKKRIQRCHLAN